MHNLITHKNKNMKTIINNDRANNEVKKLQDRAEQMTNFYNNKISVLQNNIEKLESFMKTFHGEALQIENMYSTGHNADSCLDGDSMIAHGRFLLLKEYKNTELLAKKMEEKFYTMFTREVISVQFKGWKIKNNVVEFQMWVK